MKNWWYISLAVLALGCAGQNSHEGTPEGMDTNLQTMPANEDTIVEPVERDKTRTDRQEDTITANKADLPEAIEHKAPQQDKIDAAKKAKTAAKK